MRAKLPKTPPGEPPPHLRCEVGCVVTKVWPVKGQYQGIRMRHISVMYPGSRSTHMFVPEALAVRVGDRVTMSIRIRRPAAAAKVPPVVVAAASGIPSGNPSAAPVGPAQEPGAMLPSEP